MRVCSRCQTAPAVPDPHFQGWCRSCIRRALEGAHEQEQEQPQEQGRAGPRRKRRG